MRRSDHSFSGSCSLLPTTPHGADDARAILGKEIAVRRAAYREPFRSRLSQIRSRAVHQGHESARGVGFGHGARSAGRDHFGANAFHESPTAERLDVGKHGVARSVVGEAKVEGHFGLGRDRVDGRAARDEVAVDGDAGYFLATF